MSRENLRTLSNSKHCIIVALTATEKHTRTRRWKREAGQGSDDEAIKGLTTRPSRISRPRQGLDKAKEKNTGLPTGEPTLVTGSFLLVRPGATK